MPSTPLRVSRVTASDLLISTSALGVGAVAAVIKMGIPSTALLHSRSRSTINESEARSGSRHSVLEHISQCESGILFRHALLSALSEEISVLFTSYYLPSMDDAPLCLGTPIQ